MTSPRKGAIAIEPMTADHWPAVHRIYAEGIATGDATLEREASDWTHFDHSHPQDCRLVARDGPDGAVIGWTIAEATTARKTLVSEPRLLRAVIVTV